MLVIVLFAVFGAQVYAKNVEPYGLIEDRINATFEAVRQKLPDPLNIDNLEINLPGGNLAGVLQISNFQLSGLRGYQITELKVNVLSFNMNFALVIPNVNLNTNYLADILIAELIPIYGEGKANVHLENIVIQGTGNVDLSNGIGVKNIKSELSIGDATFDVHGLLNNEDLSLIVSEIMNDTIKKFINEQHDIVAIIMNPIVENIINIILKSGGGDATTTAPF